MVTCFSEYKELVNAYTSGAVVLGIFRHISHKAQHFLMVFTFLDKLEEKNIQNFASSPNEAEEILQELKSLGLFILNSGFIRVNTEVQKQLKFMLTSNLSCSLRTKTKPDKRRPTIELVLASTQQSWKKLIDYLIGVQESIPVSVFGLLKLSGLISQPNQGSQRTSECFRFLLKPQTYQIEHLLKTILAYSRDKVKTSTFLYNISIAELGKDYSIKDTDKGLIDILSEIGLLYRYNSKSKRYYIPSIMIGLLTDSPKPVPITERFLTVETNFRIYASTTLDLHIVLLSYFLKLEYRLPGLVVGLLTRESVCEAFKDGLKACQIIEFLRNHSKNIPNNVEDQLNLWERERNRISESDGILLEEFADPRVFRDTLSKAHECGAYLWNHPTGTLIILKKSKAEPVLKYLQSLGRIDS
jgi:transcription initiation factor TFIIH subunit 4